MQTSLSLKKLFRKKKLADIFLFCLCVNLPTVKIWGHFGDKFPMSSSFLQFPLQVKKLIREYSAKYINRTGNFYFRPKLKPPFLCQYLIFFNDFFLHYRFHLDHYFNRKMEI